MLQPCLAFTWFSCSRGLRGDEGSRAFGTCVHPSPLLRGDYLYLHALGALAAIPWLQQDPVARLGCPCVLRVPAMPHVPQPRARGTSWLARCKLVQFPPSSALPAGFPTVE